MKLIVLFVLLSFASAMVVAHDLSEAAKKERARRRLLQARRRAGDTRVFTNAELRPYHHETPASSVRFTAKRKPSARPLRDLDKERAHWQKEKEKHRRELARLDARIRRLEWRLAARKARSRPGERLREDPVEKALEDSLKEMQKERRELVQDFLDRARRAGAFPGWLR